MERGHRGGGIVILASLLTLALDLGRSLAADPPTDARLAKVAEGGVDPQLVTLYLQFGRYLLMSCSRPGSNPAPGRLVQRLCFP